MTSNFDCLLISKNHIVDDSISIDTDRVTIKVNFLLPTNWFYNIYIRVYICLHILYVLFIIEYILGVCSF